MSAVLQFFRLQNFASEDDTTTVHRGEIWNSKVQVHEAGPGDPLKDGMNNNNIDDGH